MTDAKSKNSDNEVPLEKKLDDLYKLVDGIETAMITTRRADGHLVSRAMATQRRTSGSDLWFMTNVESEKFEEIALDPHVNVSYYKDRTREWSQRCGTRDPQQGPRPDRFAVRRRLENVARRHGRR